MSKLKVDLSKVRLFSILKVEVLSSVNLLEKSLFAKSLKIKFSIFALELL